MLKRFAGRHRTDLVLDAVFVVWALQIMVTGKVVPSYLSHLFHHPSTAAAVSDRKDAPVAPIQIAPLPET